MVLVIYILFSILLIMALSSVSNDEYRGGAIVLLSAQIVSILATYRLIELAENGSVVGAFFAAGQNMMISFVLIVFHDMTKTFILKLATASALFTCAHMLYIMTHIEPIRELWWYHSPIFDLFYWGYGGLQIVLTLYMISLFWESGLTGLSNGFNKVFRPNPARKYVVDVSGFHDNLFSNNNSYYKEVVQENKSYKKGIRQ